MAVEKVIRFADFERRRSDADAVRVRDPDIIIILPIIRIERVPERHEVTARAQR